MGLNEIPKGRAKGGYARAACLSQDQRSAIASEAAKIRWRGPPPSRCPAWCWKGFKSELSLAGVTIPCAVISGPRGIQRVLTENGITYAILGERSGASKRLKKAALGRRGPSSSVCRSEPAQTLHQQGVEGRAPQTHRLSRWGPGGARVRRERPRCGLQHLAQRPAGGSPSRHSNCPRRRRPSFSTRALAETGIVALVDEATGYEKVRPQNALQRYLEDPGSQRSSQPGPRNFPMSSTKTYTGSRAGNGRGMGKNRYSVVAYYTRDLVYERLGPGLLRNSKAKAPGTETDTG